MPKSGKVPRRHVLAKSYVPRGMPPDPSILGGVHVYLGDQLRLDQDDVQRGTGTPCRGEPDALPRVPPLGRDEMIGEMPDLAGLQLCAAGDGPQDPVSNVSAQHKAPRAAQRAGDRADDALGGVPSADLDECAGPG